MYLFIETSYQIQATRLNNLRNHLLHEVKGRFKFFHEIIYLKKEFVKQIYFIGNIK